MAQGMAEDVSPEKRRTCSICHKRKVDSLCDRCGRSLCNECSRIGWKSNFLSSAFLAQKKNDEKTVHCPHCSKISIIQNLIIYGGLLGIFMIIIASLIFGGQILTQ